MLQIIKKRKNVKYNLENLIKYCVEKNFKLLKEYDENEINIETIIEGTCATEGCENNFSKNYKRMITISGPYCKFCQNGRVVFNNNALDLFVKKNNIILLKDYSSIKVNRDTKIEGKCLTNDCANIFNKNFRFLVEEGGAYCDDCVKMNRIVKIENTNLENIGVKYYTQKADWKEEFTKILNDKYGVKNTMEIPGVKEKLIETNLAHFGCEYSSQNAEIKQKIINTNMDRFGVNCVLKNETIKQKIIETNLKNIGVKYPTQSKDVFEKIKKTNKARYGVEFISQNPEIAEKIKLTHLNKTEDEKNIINEKRNNTNLIIYGTKNPINNEDVKEKIISTNLKKFGETCYSKTNEFKEKIKIQHINRSEEEKTQIKTKVKKTNINIYGVEHYSQTNEYKEKINIINQNRTLEEKEKIKNKIKNTIKQNYGVENVMFVPEIAEKSMKNAFSTKEYILPSGKILKCQGYEPFALDKIINEDKISEDNIITSRIEVPEIWYIKQENKYDDEENIKKSRHYVDIFIPSKNLCIEVKSTWTFSKKTEDILAKQIAGKQLGYNYEIWIFSPKGEILNKII